MKLKNLIFILFTFGCLSIAQESNLNHIFFQANKAYQAKEYEKAIALYHSILSQGYESPELYYNLGNGYYRMNEIGKALLNYEKAYRLNPNDPEIIRNLELANLRVIDRIEFPPQFFLFQWWNKIRTFYALPQLTYIIFSLFSTTVFMFIFWLFIKRYRIRKMVLALSTVLGIITLFWIYIYIDRIHEYHNLRDAIILEKAVTVMSAPDNNSTDVFILHEGVKVHLDEQRDTWVKISLPDGKSGWVKTNVLGII